MKWYSFLLAFRNIKKFWQFSFINIIGLTIGISCVILITLWRTHENSFENFFSNPENIFLVSTRMASDPLDKGSYYTPYSLSKMLAENFPEIISYTRQENYSFFSTCNLSSTTDNDKRFYEQNFCLGDTSFFNIFDFPFKYGNAKTAFQDKNSLVLSEETAKKFFGDINPVGKSLIFNNIKELTVTGVVRVPENTQLKFDAMAVNNTIRDPNYLNGWDSNGPSFVRVNKNTNISELNNKLSTFLDGHKTPLVDDVVVGLYPLTKMHTRYGLKMLIFILSSISILILVISILNYITLSTALFSKRSKQVGISKITGALKSSISFQYIIESVLLSFMATILSIGIVELILPFFNTINESSITLGSFGGLSKGIIALCILSIIVGVISGLYPSIILALKKPLNLLRETGNSRAKWFFGRRIMVVFQFAISIFLITATIFIYKQQTFLENNPLGFNDNYMLKMPINEKILSNYTSFYNELKRNPNIVNVTAASTVPAGIDNHSGLRWGAGDENFNRNTKFAIVMPDYVKTFEMKMLEGEPFSFSDAASVYGYIINKAAADKMGFADPVGKTVNFWGRDGTVIGVVNNFQNNFRTREVRPLVLSANPDNSFFIKFIFVKINPADISNTISYIEGVSKQVAPDYPFEYNFVDQEINSFLDDGARFSKIILFFAVLAILLAALGLFGLTLFTVEKRTKEVGIRKVNGAKTTEVMGLLNKELVVWVTLAFIIAAPLTWRFMKMWLENFSYKTPLSWWVFLLAGIITMGLALLTVSFQSWKAATRNPVEALRYE